MKLLGTLFALVAVAGLVSAEEKKFDAAKMEGKQLTMILSPK